MKKFLTPDFVAPDITYATPDFLERMYIETLSVDVDGTIMSHHAKKLDPYADNYLRRVLDVGINVVLTSNAYGGRIEELAEVADSIGPEVKISAPEIITPGIKNPKKHRKPKSDMVDFVARLTNVEPDQILHVGDQLLKDIVSARRAGALCMLVPKYGGGGDWCVERLQRPIENLILPSLGVGHLHLCGSSLNSFGFGICYWLRAEERTTNCHYGYRSLCSHLIS